MLTTKARRRGEIAREMQGKRNSKNKSRNKNKSRSMRKSKRQNKTRTHQHQDYTWIHKCSKITVTPRYPTAWAAGCIPTLLPTCRRTVKPTSSRHHHHQLCLDKCSSLQLWGCPILHTERHLSPLQAHMSRHTPDRPHSCIPHRQFRPSRCNMLPWRSANK